MTSQRVNVNTKKKGRKIGAYHLESKTVRVAGGLRKPLSFFKKLGEIFYFEKYKNGKKIKSN